MVRGEQVGRSPELSVEAKQSTEKEKYLHVDDIANATPGAAIPYQTTYFEMRQRPAASDPLACFAARDGTLALAQESGKISQLTIPSFSLVRTVDCLTGSKVRSLFLNCNSSKICTLDIAAVARLLWLEEGKLDEVYLPYIVLE